MFGFKGHSLSDGLDDVQRAEMKAYMELVNNMLLTAEVTNKTLEQCESDYQYFWVTSSYSGLLSSL